MENRTVLVVTLFAVGLTCASCFGPVRGLGALPLPQEPSLTQRKQHVRCPSASCARFLMLSGRERDKDAIIDIDATKVNPYVQTPVTLLGGFLGAGKTTVLKTMIENSEGIRVGIIVNDVAEVNIDAMLIRKTSDGDVSAVADTTVELQNGCACCSIRDELFDSVRQVLELGVSRGEPFDRIVIELSGVAEPAVVKRNILRAQKGGRFAEVARAMDLRTVVTVVDASTFVDTWMSQNTMGASPLLWEGEQAQQDPCVQARPLSEFLAEQVEAADKIILNKVDLVDDRTKTTALEIIGGVMNSGKFYRQNKFSVSDEQGMKIDVDPLSVCTAVRGKVPLEFLLPERSTMKRGGGSDAANGRTGADMREEGHAGRGAKTNAEKEFGIRSIVYEARRPFSRSRLFTLFTSWPTLSLDGEIGEFLKDVILSDAARDAFKANPEAPPPTSGASLLNVVRSKGFCWVEDQANLCYYWSHAGRCFAVTSIGQWWADTSPADLESAMRENPKVMKGMLQQEWQGDFGDRRQQLVFIGAGLDEAGIRNSLDECLLSDEEMVAFTDKLDAQLKAKFSLRVICQLAAWPMPEDWRNGKVVALNYREPDWPDERSDAPYQVRLDDDSLIWVPVDDYRLIKGGDPCFPQESTAVNIFDKIRSLLGSGDS